MVPQKTTTLHNSYLVKVATLGGGGQNSGYVVCVWPLCLLRSTYDPLSFLDRSPLLKNEHAMTKTPICNDLNKPALRYEIILSRVDIVNLSWQDDDVRCQTSRTILWRGNVNIHVHFA